ncbi:MAG: hypothetical protein ACUVTO_05670 [Candidatus Caldatribacteriaceae bacterium]
MKKCFLVLFFCSVLVTFPVWAYGPPELNDTLTEVVNLRGHGTIILKVVEILRNDGYADQARFYT